MFRNLKRALGMIRMDYPFTPAANQSHLTTVMGAGVLSPNIPNGVYNVMLQATAQDVRFTLDGTDPTTTSGFVLVANAVPLIIPIVNGRTTLKFIREADGAILELQWGE